MTGTVTHQEIKLGVPSIVSVSATSQELLPSRLGRSHRKTFYIVPLTAGVIVTISPTETPAVATQGYVLSQYQPYLDVRSQGYDPYQGAWQVVASGNGSIAVVEVVD